MNIMLQILNAISYIHSKGVVHRDLNLDNILIIKNEDEIVVKIIDFTSGKLNYKY